MDILVLVLALATFCSTLFGGFTILKFKNSLHYFFAFGAGSIIAVAFLDLLPESIEIAENNSISLRTILVVVVLSFLFYSLIEKFFLTHHMHGHEHGHIMGPIGAGSLVIHSFLDGAAIGIAFQADAITGMIVALAVIMHDMTDGVNTVSIMLKNKHSAKKAKMFLIMDAVAPVLGLIVTSLIVIPEKALAYLLAVFVGEFLYIGAASLLPETHEHNSFGVVSAMVFGVALIVALTSLL